MTHNVSTEQELVDVLMSESAAEGRAVEGGLYRLTEEQENEVKATIGQDAWPIQVGPYKVTWDNIHGGLRAYTGENPIPKPTYRKRTAKQQENLDQMEPTTPFEHVVGQAPEPKKTKGERVQVEGRDVASQDDMVVYVAAGVDGGTIDEFEEICAQRGGMAFHHIPRVMGGIRLGDTKCFLAHDEGVRGKGVVFGWFTIEVCYLVSENAEDPRLALGESKGVAITLITEEAANELGLSSVRPGKLYIGGKLQLLEHIVDAQHPRFRSYARCKASQYFDAPEVPRPHLQLLESVGQVGNLGRAEGERGNGKWTEEEKALLQSMLRQVPDVYPTRQAAMIVFAEASGRSWHSVQYQVNINSIRRRGAESAACAAE